MNKIGIVGGSGFIGSALGRHLSRSFLVKILDKKPAPKDLEEETEYQQLNIEEYDKVEQGLRDVDLVIHAAIVQIPLINEAKKRGYEVNIMGTHNVCEAVNRNPLTKGMILTGTWHVVGERELRGVIDEEFGFRPDKVEDRARLYALCKIGQEIIVRLYGEISEKTYGVVRMGTVLGKGMPKETAAARFIAKGLEGEPLTPYKHSAYRPMLYTDVNDICRAFEVYARKILKGEIRKEGASLSHIVNVYWPEPITILELAEMTRNAIIKYSNGKIRPEIEIVDKEQPVLFTPESKKLIKIDASRAKNFLELEKMTNPKETMEEIIKERIAVLR